MGMGATNTLDRLSTSIGNLNGVALQFKDCMDVPNAGVLLALPALLSQGLLRNIDTYFKLSKGYYTLPHIFLLMAFMALSRLKFIEDLKYIAPGEWGKLLGLDRVPEARTMRNKVHQLSDNGQPKEWSAQLCKEWMAHTPNETGVLYVDGHVRVYHGGQTKLPRHYVSRDKLCARGTVDYWVNAMDGKPFFYVSKTVDPGLIEVLENEIIPRLEKDIPNQPTEEELKLNPYLCRFTIIVDREGYSPELMGRLWKDKRIAVQTYHKYPKDNWNEEEFINTSVNMPSGNIISLKLAERGSCIGKMTKTDNSSIWVREIRNLKNNNTQGSIISTSFNANLIYSFVMMKSRWSQENFFKYAAREYNLDRLMDYDLEEMSDTTKLVNPKYRTIDSAIRKIRSKLSRKKAVFAGETLKGEIETKKINKFEEKKGELLSEINQLEIELNEKVQERKKHPKHVLFKDLSEEHKFQQLKSTSKHLIDTIKMIAYRSETVMASIVKECIPASKHGIARVLLTEIYTTEGDILVNEENKTLTVRLHHLANKSSDEVVRYLCKELNETETVYPGTEYRMIYELVS